jgi:hypothetical protein
MMAQDLEQTTALLARTPAALDAILRDLPEAWTLRNEGENSWSAFDIVGHLIHGERTDWMPRVKMVLEFGESQTFRPDGIFRVIVQKLLPQTVGDWS